MPTNAITDSLKTALAKDFAGLGQVHHIETECTDRALLLWIFLEDASPSARRKIYPKQPEIISRFPEVDFDFNLVAPSSRRASEISTTDAR